MRSEAKIKTLSCSKYWLLWCLSCRWFRIQGKLLFNNTRTNWL